ncbi:hypothetical protein KAR91_51380 [Candidatus Pacearchaeota archaeon]|nr:hypothetical protein [Candidatus Pacearchaeota archaeon]
MPKKIEYTEEKLEDIKKLFQTGMSVRDISNKYETSIAHMRMVLRTKYPEPLYRKGIWKRLHKKDYAAVQEKYKSGILVKDIAKEYGLSYPGMRHAIRKMYHIDTLTELKAYNIPHEYIKSKIEKGHKLTHLLVELNLKEKQTTAAIRTIYNKSINSIREEGKLQIKEDVLQHGFSTVTTYIEDNDIGVCPHYFRIYFNLSYNDIFNAKRTFKKCKVQAEYAKLCASTKQVVTTVQLKKLSPKLGNLVNYYFGSIRTLREAV